jgi:hypothetical protein
MQGPDYTGRSLVNLVAHVEQRLTGDAPSPGLAHDLAVAMPRGEGAVMLLIDGLGFEMVRELADASPLKAALVGRLDASFSTQTSVATATLATGLSPSQHGLAGYLLFIPEADAVVNTLWWMTTDGDPTEIDRSAFLPAPNLAERLSTRDVEAVVVEPEGFLGSPLDEVLYRGAKTVGVADMDAFVDTIVSAAGSDVLVLGYLPQVDAAGHLAGPGSDEHRAAIAEVTSVWAALSDSLDPSIALFGSADHGMVRATEWIDLETPDGVALGGDSRVLFAHGSPGEIESWARHLPGTSLITREHLELWGPPPHHPALLARLPHLLHFAPEGTVFHHAGNPMHLVGYHGGLTAAEIGIPLLVRPA